MWGVTNSDKKFSKLREKIESCDNFSANQIFSDV